LAGFFYAEIYTKCNFKTFQSYSGIMPMVKNVKANRVHEIGLLIFPIGII